MMTFLAVIHILACLGLVGLVLIQDSKGGGVFSSQSSSTSVLGATGATTLAQTMTKALALLFAITCISLSIMSARSEKSVIDTMPAQTQALPPAGETVPPPAGSPAPTTSTPAAAGVTTTQPAAAVPAATEPKK